MKYSVVVALFLIVAVNAEVPRNRPGRLRSRFLARQEAAPADFAPYAPSGWRPDGPAFELPSPQENPQPGQYGPPQPEYGSPDQEYGTPAPAAPDTEQVTSIAESVATEQQSERLKVTTRKSQKLTAAENPDDNSFYVLVGDQMQKLVLAKAQLTDPQNQKLVLAAAPQSQKLVVAPSIQGIQYFGNLQASTAFGSGFVYTPQYVQVY